MAEENIPEGKPKPKKKISIVRIVLLLLVINWNNSVESHS